MSDTNARIADIVTSNDVVLFMKGTPLFPQCGFSSRAVAILEHLGVTYEGVDVLQDMEIRQGIKAFSDWPTIPQLYVKGEFVGGCDIVTEMTLSGELDALFEATPIPVVVKDTQGRYVRMNRAYHDLLAGSQERAVDHVSQVLDREAAARDAAKGDPA